MDKRTITGGSCCMSSKNDLRYKNKIWATCFKLILFFILHFIWSFVQVPVSQCSVPCPPGSRQARRPGQPHCCFDCLPCADGEISNQTGSPYMFCVLIYFSNHVSNTEPLKQLKCSTLSTDLCTVRVCVCL